MNVCIVQPSLDAVSETFIHAHANHLPADVTVIHGHNPHLGDRPVLSQSLLARAGRKATRILTGRPWEWEYTVALLRALRKTNPDVVLAEYGPTGVAVQQACEIVGIPLVVHFHGYDASKHSVLKRYQEGYQKLFRRCQAIVAVSTAMQKKLVMLGAPAQRVHINPYGVDCTQFQSSNSTQFPSEFLAVGRFTEKKGPYLTVLAFAEAHRQDPEIHLTMIGDGPLLGPCRDMVCGLGIEAAVSLLGAQPHDVVADKMRDARAFVQHSIEASDGDCEGTPVAVIEAGASGLPVISTRHAGIPDVVVEGQTGFLVDERDVVGMSKAIIRIAKDPALAAQMGRAARKRIEQNFSMEKSISRLWSIIESSVDNFEKKCRT